MKRKTFIKAAALAASGSALAACSEGENLSGGKILHTVMFKLKHPKGSAEENKFLKDSFDILSSVPSARNFKILRQIGKKNDFDFAFSMIFDNQAGYDAYNNYPAHLDYVKNRWQREVEKFLESDFSPYEA